MGRRKKGTPVHGWINLDKPANITSTKAVAIVRRALNAQKAGHAGTLDPLASGMLPIALGEATKTVPFVQDRLKTYRFSVTWGEARTTDDAEGDTISTSDRRPSREEIGDRLPSYTGFISQQPPRFSAIKIDGARAYDLAREGENVEIAAREVEIDSLKIEDHQGDTTDFVCHCGKGTYVRSLARDLGNDLGCFGYISALRRIDVGPFSEEKAISLDFFEEMIDNPDRKHETASFLLPLETALDDIPVLVCTQEEAARLQNGNAVSFVSKPALDRLERAGIDWEAGDTALALFEDRPIGLLSIEGAQAKPFRVFNLN